MLSGHNEGHVTMAQMGKWGCSQQTDLRASTKALQGASGARASSPTHPDSRSGCRPHTYHTLHLLGDVIALLAVRSLDMRLGLPLALGAGLQVSSQGAAATLVPAGTTLDLRPTVIAQSLVNNLDNGNGQLSVTWDLHRGHQEKMTNRSHRIRPKLPKTQNPQCRLSCLQVERQPGGLGKRPQASSSLTAGSTLPHTPPPSPTSPQRSS